VNLCDSTLPFPLLVGGAGSDVEEKLLA
jgi:hypothetical protein